ncbi:MAG TPA: Asp-tRNA(Asn)/Glu-tRNA(Gln) amidotransferase subunit GatB [Verrucomicrobiae bacterium]|nr:Asp-tRNA(Asn)/Glu-tRNA(Gln) amidotransferase subunit GatB [Verrucomicrobiae bacterium]
MQYEAVIGLEVHVQLKTRSKMFCGCATEFGAEPNTHVCPVCLGYPGVLPVMNEEAVRKTILTGLMIGSEITRLSKWDRKNYFYPDMPKNYQISQYDLPLCVHGAVEIKLDGGQTKKIGVTRAHLEEDVAKNFHFETTSGVDFNRAGTPLMEIVSEPDMRSADEAFAYLTALKEILMSGDVSDCDMEKGQLRCDSNVSVRPVGQKEFGEKVEIKNMNTISGVRRALAYEIQRQTAALQKGEKVSQETRRWDDETGRTSVMRTKEYAHDYRYFPEPDLMPVVVSDEMIADVRKRLPELPEAKRQRFVKQYGLPEYDAGVLVADAALAAFYEQAAGGSKNPKAIANWVMTELLGKLGEAKVSIVECPIKPAGLAELVALIDGNQISGKIGKEVFIEMFASGKRPSEIVREKGLVQVSDTGALEGFVEQAIASNPKSVADFRAGNEAAINFLKGQVMKLSKGKANPQLVGEILLRKLKGGGTPGGP